MRRTKIVATLAPASIDPDVFGRLVEAGADVARINLSHGSVDRHRATIRMVRETEERLGRPIAILLDTAGPEVRIKTRGPGLELQEGQHVRLGPGTDLELSIANVLEMLDVGDDLVVGDGNIVLRVSDMGAAADMVVRQGGYLSNNKKISCPNRAWPLPVLTPSDEEALKMGIEEGVDWIAASFIRSGDDLVVLRRQLEQWGGSDLALMAKIETRLAIDNLAEIVRLADGLMVARGDLGVEFPPEDVPWLQKTIIDAANRSGKPVITATQMLESMVQAERPTRAEITDIAHAVLEGTDAVMLSEETAVGEHPVEAVRVMARAAAVSEEHPWDGMARPRYGSKTVTDAVCHAALTAAEDLDARVIVTATETGHTAVAMAAHRPRVPILAVTPHDAVARRLTLVWGLNTQLMTWHGTLEGMIEESVAIAAEQGWAATGDRVIVTAGAPVGEAGSTNVLRVMTIGEVFLKGQGMGPEGEVRGEAVVVADPAAVSPASLKGKVLVAPETDGEWVPLMQEARAIVVEAGGLTSHAAVVGVSLGIPTVVGAEGAMRTCKTGMLLTVDAVSGRILNG